MLAISLGFSILLDVRRPGDDPRADLARWVRVTSRRPGAARPRGAPGATSAVSHRPSAPGLPPGHRVVALGEVDGMPHPVRVYPARRAFAVGHPGDLPPPGEGVFLG